MNKILPNSSQRIICIVIMAAVLVHTINPSKSLHSQRLPSYRPKRSADSQHTRNHHRRHRHRNVTSLLNSAVDSSELGYARVITDDGKDVPRFVCGDGELACALPSEDGPVLCIARERMCDYKIDCPGATDEDPTQCSFLRLQQQLTTGGSPSHSCAEQEERITGLEQKLNAMEDYVNDIKTSLDTHRHCGSSDRVIFGNTCPSYSNRRRIRHSGT